MQKHKSHSEKTAIPYICASRTTTPMCDFTVTRGTIMERRSNGPTGSLLVGVSRQRSLLPEIKVVK